jgi:hypothetical protein
MLIKEFFKLLGGFVGACIAILAIAYGIGYYKGYSDSNYCGGSDVFLCDFDIAFSTHIFELFALVVAIPLFGIGYWVWGLYRLARLSHAASAADATLPASDKAVYFGIELIYWLFAVYLPLWSLFASWDFGQMNYYVYLVAVLVFGVVSSVLFWRNVHPPLWRSLIFAAIGLLFVAYLLWIT